MADVITVRVSDNVDQFIRQLDQLGKDVADKATVSALNKVAAQARTAAAKTIRAAGYNLKASVIKDQMRISKASPSRLIATVTARGKPIPLINYGARPVSGGVSVNVLKGRKVIAHAFIATMPSGHRGVFIRQGSTHKKVVKGGRVVLERLPIKQLFGPSVPDAMGNAAVMQALQDLVQTKFGDILRSEVAYYTSRLKK